MLVPQFSRLLDIFTGKCWRFSPTSEFYDLSLPYSHSRRALDISVRSLQVSRLATLRPRKGSLIDTLGPSDNTGPVRHWLRSSGSRLPSRSIPQPASPPPEFSQLLDLKYQWFQRSNSRGAIPACTSISFIDHKQSPCSARKPKVEHLASPWLIFDRLQPEPVLAVPYQAQEGLRTTYLLHAPQLYPLSSFSQPLPFKASAKRLLDLYHDQHAVFNNDVSRYWRSVTGRASPNPNRDSPTSESLSIA